MVDIAEICKKYGINERLVQKIVNLQNISDENRRLRELEALLDEI